MELPSDLVSNFVNSLARTDSTTEKNKTWRGLVKRVREDDVVMVQLEGSDYEIPATLAVNAIVGDYVNVTIENHMASIVGNVTAPPTDDTVAEIAQNGVNNTLIFDTSYEIRTEGSRIWADFTAHMYRAGVDLAGTEEFPDRYFQWYLKGESGGEDNRKHKATGRTFTLQITEGTIGYGATVIGEYEPSNEVELLSTLYEPIANNDDVQLIGLADVKDRIRIIDLAEISNIESSDYMLGFNSRLTYKSSVQNYMDVFRDEIEDKSELTAAQASALFTI